jgi:hypothetical protein
MQPDLAWRPSVQAEARHSSVGQTQVLRQIEVVVVVWHCSYQNSKLTASLVVAVL